MRHFVSMHGSQISFYNIIKAVFFITLKTIGGNISLLYPEWSKLYYQKHYVYY
jgi:hypothetical protein